MRPRMIHPRKLLFSQSVALGKAFEKYARKNNAALCWESFVAFLSSNGMLNEEAVMRFLEKENDDGRND